MTDLNIFSFNFRKFRILISISNLNLACRSMYELVHARALGAVAIELSQVRIPLVALPI